LLVCLVVATLPWTINRWIEPFLYRRSVRNARRELAKVGLTPDQYMATINANDPFAVAAAKTRLGLE
jgi:hypothetical protein